MKMLAASKKNLLLKNWKFNDTNVFTNLNTDVHYLDVGSINNIYKLLTLV